MLSIITNTKHFKEKTKRRFVQKTARVVLHELIHYYLIYQFSFYNQPSKV